MKKGLMAILAIFLTSVCGVFVSRNTSSVDKVNITTQTNQYCDVLQSGKYKVKIDPRNCVIYGLQNGNNQLPLIDNIADRSEGLSIAYDTESLPYHYANWEKVNKVENCLKLKCKNNSGQYIITRTILLEQSGKITVYDEINEALISNKNIRKNLIIRNIKKSGFHSFRLGEGSSSVHHDMKKILKTDCFGIENRDSAIFFACTNKESDILKREFRTNNGIIEEISCSYSCSPKENIILACLEKDSEVLNNFKEYGFNKIKSVGIRQILTWPFEKILYGLTHVFNNGIGILLFVIFGLLVITPLYILDFKQRRFLESLRLSPLLLMNKMAILQSFIWFTLTNVFTYMFVKLALVGVINNNYSLADVNFLWFGNISLPDQLAVSNLLPSFFSFLNPFTGITQLICFFSLFWIFVMRNTKVVNKWYWLKGVLIYFILYSCNSSQSFIMIFTVYLLCKEVISREILKRSAL